MGGRSWRRRACADRPDLRVLFVSGYTKDSVLREDIEGAEIAFLEPYTPLVLGAEDGARGHRRPVRRASRHLPRPRLAGSGSRPRLAGLGGRRLGPAPQHLRHVSASGVGVTWQIRVVRGSGVAQSRLNAAPAPGQTS